MKAEVTFDNVVVCLKPNPAARLRFFCFPFAGGRARFFNSWVDALPEDVRRETELWSIDWPGREANRGEPRFTRLPSLVDVVLARIEPHLDKPFGFFGHSMGALVSFELTRQLRRFGLSSPVHLVVSGHRAPHLPDRHPAIHHLPDPEFMAGLREYGGTPEEVLQNPELMALFMPVLRADFAVCETYVYKPQEPLDCSITGFGGMADPRVSREELLAWQVQTRKSFALRMLPGDHFFLQSSHTLALYLLGQDLQRILRRLPHNAVSGS